MIKVFRRVIASIALFAIIAGALRAVFNWISRTDGDEHELWSDEEDRVDA